ncbi:LAMI_0B07756g1_1 [Lachancea mirantina]|uniref:LAMI_0B07756g1_1 n=1 Tax=Lachancea mirantina TaxID=1230905 RepID=A0A1G4IXE1_9SACH|nr:LAMI_0B07756g1_1 [Lachancea mirantina]
MSGGHDSSLLENVVKTVRASSALAAQDITFYRRIDTSVATSIDSTAHRLLNLLNGLLLSIDENNEPVQDGQEGLGGSWRNIGNALDTVFETSDLIYTKIVKPQDALTGGASRHLEDSISTSLTPAKRIEKPQNKFARAVDNSELHPFKPLLKSKPNALRGLDEVLKLTPETDEEPRHFEHPYFYEVEIQPYDDSVLKIREPIESKPWEGTSASWVDEVDTLKDMAAELHDANEIAIDLEHHDYRSYYGITCLMQISTREKDWLVDTIALRDDLQILNEVLTDPKITKVFHGAFMDIIWLQRDLGLYVVGLFDTYHASRLLGFPRHSLAFLLEKYANFKTSKKYQLADWRVRPLTKALVTYARGDTHFLLNIYDHLRNALIEQGKLAQALANSRDVAKRRFEYSAFRPKVDKGVFVPSENQEPWRPMMYSYNIPFKKELLVRRLYEWRDAMARRDDESPRYVMPNQLLVSLAALGPVEPAGVLSVAAHVTDHVRANCKAISQLIKKAADDINGNPITSFRVNDKSQESDSHRVNLTDVKQQVTIFHNLVAQREADSKLCQKLAKHSRVLLPPSLNEAIIYKIGRKEIINEKVLYTRQGDLNEKLSEPALPEKVELALGDTRAKNDLPSERLATSTEDSVNLNIKSDDLEKDNDKNEVVVLKKKSNKPKTSKTQKPHTEPIDYKNAKSVLQENTGKAKPYKRKLDPYAIQESAPPGLKKRKKTRGKQASFKR